MSKTRSKTPELLSSLLVSTGIASSHIRQPRVKENCRVPVMLSKEKHLWSNVRNRMTADAAIRTTVALIALSLVLVGCHKRVAVAQVDPNGPVEVVIPEHGAYTGAFMDFGDAEDDVTLETIEDFEQMTGKHQAIIASSSYWGEQNFPTDNLNVIWRHGSLPLVFWSPWDRPYEEDHGPDKFSLTEILSGRWDAYIDMWGDAARSFGQIGRASCR